MTLSPPHFDTVRLTFAPDLISLHLEFSIKNLSPISGIVFIISCVIKCHDYNILLLLRFGGDQYTDQYTFETSLSDIQVIMLSHAAFKWFIDVQSILLLTFNNSYY